MTGLNVLYFSLVAVGKLAELSDRHGLLLNVVLCEKARLACYILLNWCRYHQFIYIVVRASRLPFLWGDNLEGEKWTLSYYAHCSPAKLYKCISFSDKPM